MGQESLDFDFLDSEAVGLDSEAVGLDSEAVGLDSDDSVVGRDPDLDEGDREPDLLLLLPFETDSKEYSTVDESDSF